MILDKQNEFSLAQAITAQAVSTNVLDLGVARRIGDGEPVKVQCTVDVAMTDASSDSTISVELITDDNAAMSSATLLQTIGIFPALSAIGARVLADISPLLAFERYVAIRYTPTGGSLTTGSFTTRLVKDASVQKAYSSGFAVGD